MQMAKLIHFKLLMPAAFFFILFGALASAQPAGCTGWDSSGNALLSGNYYIRHVTWQVGDAAGDLADAASVYGEITFDGTAATITSSAAMLSTQRIRGTNTPVGSGGNLTGEPTSSPRAGTPAWIIC